MSNRKSSKNQMPCFLVTAYQLIWKKLSVLIKIISYKGTFTSFLVYCKMWFSKKHNVKKEFTNTSTHCSFAIKRRSLTFRTQLQYDYVSCTSFLVSLVILPPYKLLKCVKWSTCLFTFLWKMVNQVKDLI